MWRRQRPDPPQTISLTDSLELDDFQAGDSVRWPYLLVAWPGEAMLLQVPPESKKSVVRSQPRRLLVIGRGRAADGEIHVVISSDDAEREGL